jgi:hypothetical protein
MEAHNSKNGQTGLIRGPSRKASEVGNTGSTVPSACTTSDQSGSMVVSALLRGMADSTHLYAFCGVVLLPNRATAMGGSTKIF